MLKIQLVAGKVAPRYGREVLELAFHTAVITENGMGSGLPVVDLQLADKDGNAYFAAISGRQILALAEAIQGVNYRNHGSTNP